MSAPPSALFAVAFGALLVACGGSDESLRPVDLGPGRDRGPMIALDAAPGDGGSDADADEGPPVLDAEPPDGGPLDGRPLDEGRADEGPPDEGPSDEGVDEGVPGACPAGMVRVPAGDFPFGPAGDLRFLPDFCIDVTEVSAGAFLDCVDDGGCDGYEGWALCIDVDPRRPHQCREDRLDHPANWIDWFRAEQYCRWAGLRLPDPGEWEKAARGPEGRVYPWGDRFDCSRAHVERGHPFDACLGRGGLPDLPVAVDAYADVPSPYGAINMVGNVREWVDLRVDRGALPDDEEMGIAKGGEWRSSADQVMNSDFDGTLAVSRSSQGHGFRCAATPR